MSDHARPARALVVAVDGAEISAVLGRALASAIVRQVLGWPAVAELAFADPDVTALASLAVGATLSLRAGTAGLPLFEGRIAALEQEHAGDGGHAVRVRAHDPLQAARGRRRIRALPDTSATDLLGEIAAAIGLEAAVAGPTPRRALVIQRGESDLELLHALAEPLGLHPVVAAGRLQLLALDGGAAEPIRLVLGRGLRRVVLRQGTEAALRRVRAGAWNAATLQGFEEDAGLARQDAFELRGTSLPDGEGDAFLPGRLADTAEEAAALAQAVMDRAAAAEATAEGSCDGDPGIAPGRPIRIEGVADAVAGRYVVTEATHRLDAAEGYVTGFSTAPPPPARRTASPWLALGTIGDADDPEAMGRCRARLDAFAGVETGWMPVLVPGAGSGKGLVALPEAGDRVLIAFPEGDPARGIILGGLHGDQPLPRGLGGAGRGFVLRSAAGLAALELGGRSEGARLGIAAGSVLEMTPGAVRLAAAADLLIEAPGAVITIRGRAIRFEET